MTSGSSRNPTGDEGRRRLRESSDAALKAALARWSDPETMRNVGPYSNAKRVRYYAGVLVPGCFFDRGRKSFCHLDECGKDACQRECEYLLDVQTILRSLKRRGISCVGAQEKLLEEALENLQEPSSEQASLSDWL